MARRASAMILSILVTAAATFAWVVAAPTSASATPMRETAGGMCSTECQRSLA